METGVRLISKETLFSHNVSSLLQLLKDSFSHNGFKRTSNIENQPVLAKWKQSASNTGRETDLAV